MWAVSSDSPYEGFFSLKSVNPGDSIVFTRTINNPDGGQVSFFHKSKETSGWVGRTMQTTFFIDNKPQTTFTDEGWALKAFPISSGLHKFKWINNGGSGYTNIDYFICPK